MSNWNIVEDEFYCEHPLTEIRQKVNRAGVKMFQHQCLDCGAGVGTYIAHKDTDGNPPLFDGDLALSYHRKKRQRLNELNELDRQSQLNKTGEFWESYNEYLESEEWEMKRRVVLKRDNYLCQACRLKAATQVHHLTYKHCFNEPLFELVSVCKECHNKITELDKGEGSNG